MEIIVSSGSVRELEEELILVSLFEGSPPRSELVKDLDEALGGELRDLVELGDFTGKFLQTYTLYPRGRIRARRLMVVGLGPESEISLERLRQVLAHATRQIIKLGLNGFASMIHSVTMGVHSPGALARAMVEGATLAAHRLQAFRSSTDEASRDLDRLRILTWLETDLDEILEGAREGTIHALAANQARDLLTSPANIVDIERMVDAAWDVATAAQEEGVSDRVTVNVLRIPQLQELGCGGILGVGQGSTREPCMVSMVYRGGKEGEAPVVMVGKGVTFDSGGLSLKTAGGMVHAKYDKTGAAAVIAVLRAAIRLHMPINLAGVIPLAENMPGGGALRPGDIIHMSSGLTVEVENTDAEGRLILGDALHYALQFRPAAVVDLATLTGAVAQTFGGEALAILGNSARLMALLIAAGEISGERIWPLPLWDVYGKKIESHQADIKNLGGRYAGTITAGKFLQRFVGDVPWAHLDVAGPIWIFDDDFYSLHGPTGAGVRLLLHFLGILSDCRLAGRKLDEFFTLSREELAAGTLPGITEREANVSLSSLARELNEVARLLRETSGPGRFKPLVCPGD